MSSDSGTRHRVRSFVASRSASQRVGALLLVALLVTAPFGGLSRSDTNRYAPLHLAHRYDIGPFYLTIDKVVSASDLAPAISPQRKRDRLLVIEITLENHTDEEEDVATAVGTIGGDHTGAIPWPDEVANAREFGTTPPETAIPKAFNVADASPMDTEPVNPGQSYQLAVVLEQDAGWDPDDLVLSIQGLVKGDSATTLDDDAWIQRLYLAQGHVAVEVKP